MDFYMVLQKIMTERDLSIPDLARLSGLPDSTLRSAVVRKQKSVALDVACKLARGLGVSLDYLNYGEDPEIENLNPRPLIRLKELRTSAKLTQQEVAAHLGVERSTYVKYERGNSDPPSSALVKLADMFGVSVDYLLGHDVPCGGSALALAPSEADLLRKYRLLSNDSQAFILRTVDSEYQATLGARSV